MGATILVGHFHIIVIGIIADPIVPTPITLDLPKDSVLIMPFSIFVLTFGANCPIDGHHG
jgi:hypothetical protein